jgi:hypothetical protein
MKLKWILLGGAGLLLVVVALASLGGLFWWRSTTGGTYGAMQTAACAGDPDGFFRYVNRPKLRTNIANRLGGGGLTEIGVGIGLQDWEADIKRGDRGDICHLELVEWGNGDKRAKVLLRTRSGNRKTWHFEREGGGWSLIDVE